MIVIMIAKHSQASRPSDTEHVIASTGGVWQSVVNVHKLKRDHYGACSASWWRIRIRSSVP